MVIFFLLIFRRVSRVININFMLMGVIVIPAWSHQVLGEMRDREKTVGNPTTV